MFLCIPIEVPPWLKQNQFLFELRRSPFTNPTIKHVYVGIKAMIGQNNEKNRWGDYKDQVQLAKAMQVFYLCFIDEWNCINMHNYIFRALNNCSVFSGLGIIVFHQCHIRITAESLKSVQNNSVIFYRTD